MSSKRKIPTSSITDDVFHLLSSLPEDHAATDRGYEQLVLFLQKKTTTGLCSEEHIRANIDGLCSSCIFAACCSYLEAICRGDDNCSPIFESFQAMLSSNFDMLIADMATNSRFDIANIVYAKHLFLLCHLCIAGDVRASSDGACTTALPNWALIKTELLGQLVKNMDLLAQSAVHCSEIRSVLTITRTVVLAFLRHRQNFKVTATCGQKSSATLTYYRHQRGIDLMKSAA